MASTRWVRGLLAVALAATVGLPPADADTTHGLRLRVVTYNIRAGSGDDGVFNLARTAGEIRSLHADVVGLQEVDVHWGARSHFVDEARDLATRLGMRVFFAPIYDLDPPVAGGPRRQFGVAVLSRYPVVDAKNHELPRLSTQDQHPVLARRPGFAEVIVDFHGRHAHVYCTHLDYRPDPAVRRAQVDDMLGVLGGTAEPKVLVGDFNAQSRAPELAPVWRRLRDADPRGGDTYPAGAPTRRIDLIAVSPEIAVLDAHRVLSAASDHLPVVADLALGH